MKKYRIGLFSIIMVIFSVLTVLIVKLHPVGDWVSEPLLVYLIMAPISLIQIILMIIVFIVKTKKVILYIQLTLFVILFFLMIDYIIGHYPIT